MWQGPERSSDVCVVGQTRCQRRVPARRTLNDVSPICGPERPCSRGRICAALYSQQASASWTKHSHYYITVITHSAVHVRVNLLQKQLEMTSCVVMSKLQVQTGWHVSSGSVWLQHDMSVDIFKHTLSQWVPRGPATPPWARPSIPR